MYQAVACCICIALLVIPGECSDQYKLPDDDTVVDPTGKKFFKTDSAAGILLQGARYLPVVSKRMKFPVYSKAGGYSQAVQDFTALPFTGYLKEWGDGSMVGIVGTKALVLMQGPYTNHGWISIRSRENRYNVQAQVWYLAPENTEAYENENDDDDED